MNLICKITDKDVLGIDGICNAEPRYTARAVMRNSENLYAVMYCEKFNIYSLPGGGIENGENRRQALEREILEETGCFCDLVSEIGCIYENRNYAHYTQYSYYYLVETKGRVQEPKLTETEIINKTQVQWHPFEKVRELILNQNTETVQQKFLKARDKAALNYYASHSDICSIGVIKEIKEENLSECVQVIRNSFLTVANDFGFTQKNAPMFTAFSISEEKLSEQLDRGIRMFANFENGKITGFYSIEFYNKECELRNLCVISDKRHKGVGENMILHSVAIAEENGCDTISISIVEENQSLKKWYEKFGFVFQFSKNFENFPFTCGYYKKELKK